MLLKMKKIQALPFLLFISGLLGVSAIDDEKSTGTLKEEPRCGTEGLTGIRTKYGRAIDSSHDLWGSSGAGLVPFQYQSSCLPTDIPLFEEAMAYIESISCVRFVPRTSEVTYLEFARACYSNGTIINSCGSCSCFRGSYVTSLRGSGTGTRVRLVTGATLEAGDYTGRGHITHELLHALGHHHTQKRPDRDDYITIDMSKNSANSQYTTCFGCDPMGTQYDCMSVMHYRDWAFANSNDPTMVAIDPLTCDVKSTNRFLRWADIDLINANYQCLDPLPLVSGQGVLKSHLDYPVGNYPANTFWIEYLVVAPGNTIELTFVDGFEIESETDCKYDYVKIVDSNGLDLIPRSCGFTTSLSVTSTTNRVSIEFVSDSAATEKGFKLQWKEVGEMSTSTTIITTTTAVTTATTSTPATTTSTTATTATTTATTTNATTSTATATTMEPDCWKENMGLGKLARHRTIKKVESAQECYDLCLEDDKCEYFQFKNPRNKRTGTCELKYLGYKNKTGFFSGNKNCTLTLAH